MFLPSYLLGCLLFHCDFFTPMAKKYSLVDFMVPAIADLDGNGPTEKCANVTAPRNLGCDIEEWDS